MTVSKKQKSIGVGIVGVAGLGVAGVIIYKLLKKDDTFVPIIAQSPFVIPQIPISLENIRLLIADISYTQAEKIAILTSMYNEQFIIDQDNQTEVIAIQADIDALNDDILIVKADLVPLQKDVDDSLIIVKEKQAIEANKYDIYRILNNELTVLQAKLATANSKRDKCFFLNVFCWAQYTMQIDDYSSQVSKKSSQVANAYNVFMDAEQYRKDAENDYNTDIGTLETYKKDYLFPLQEQLIIATNSLNMWKIAYQASHNVIKAIQKELSIFGVVI